MTPETKLKQLAQKASVEYTDKGDGHIHLKGALLVSYYPNSKNKTAYVAGTTKAIKNVSPEKAVSMCNKVPVNQGITDPRKGNHSRRQRKAMIKKGITKCCWCDDPLTLDTSTIEHVIPLARGGLDNANNRTLACKKCNGDRGSDMPELNINHQ